MQRQNKIFKTEINRIYTLVLLACICFVFPAKAQTGSLEGNVVSAGNSSAMAFANVIVKGTSHGAICNENGGFLIKNIPAGKHIIAVSFTGYLPKEIVVFIQENAVSRLKNITLEVNPATLKEVVVAAEREKTTGMARLNGVEGTAIYEGKKNEVILLKDIDANLATNNTRQIFAKVPGLNIIENDGAGIQLGMAVRGLNPNRISEFNSRQNGYDISADALGYPESYYTPPTEGVERIEVIRGAASLQYGSQFGGLLNFIFKQAPEDKPFELNFNQTVGSYGLLNSFLSGGGTVKKLSYYGFLHHKQGDGWRENSGFNINTGFSALKYKFTDKLQISTELTVMQYDMQQAGGLTDAQFKADPRKSNRDRNWFSATWIIPSVSLDYEFSENTKLNFRNFALIGSRSSLGNLIAPNQNDYKLNRNLMVDNYSNIGSETRFIHTYKIADNKATVLTGVRYYRGNTHRRQGFGSEGKDADYSFINPDDLEGSDFRFPSTNIAFFTENIFRIGSRFTITPGFRYEYIQTNAKGYYKLDNQTFTDTMSKARSFPLFGIGLSYHLTDRTDFYFNLSQAYSGVNFNDMRVLNPNFRVDANLKDVSGYNLDFGYRGKVRNFLSFDLGGFYLAYNDRIGVLNKVDENFNIYRYRTNIADSRSMGAEAYSELNITKLCKFNRCGSLSIFGSFAYVDARYINTPSKAIQNKKVEYAPEQMLRAGTTFRFKKFSTTFQVSRVSEQFTDATNTRYTINAINGVIPAYQVMDLSASFQLKKFTFSGSVNNLANTMYFTRRAEGYPGPGILPSDGRSFFLTVGVKL